MRISMVSPLLLLAASLACDPDGVADDDGVTESHCDSCDLDHWMPALVAEGAVDCGRIELGGDPAAAVDCVDEALGTGAPFMVRQQLQGIDSQVELGFLVDRDAVVQQLTHDTNLCGAPMCTEHCGPIVWIQECTNPRVGAVPANLIIDCDPGETAALCEPPPPV